jgi:polyphosphate glucokinase
VARRLGIDIGGTGMKAAPVETRTGRLLADRYRIPTPQPPTPEAMAAVVGELVTHFSWTAPIGICFPAVVQHGVVRTAANIDPAWVGVDAVELFSAAAGRSVTVVNDADAAGLAEVLFGAARDRSGTVLVVTLGTGIGSALFVDGVLVPNTELGHLVVRGKPAEQRAAESVRESKGLSWKQWADRLEEYFVEVERLLWPDLIVIGGGVSKKSEKFIPHLDLRAEVVPAELRNEAGIVGAALSAGSGRAANSRS